MNPDVHAPAPEPTVRLLFVEDLAAMIRRERPAVRKALREGRLGPYVRIGRRLAVQEESFRRFLANSEIGAP